MEHTYRLMQMANIPEVKKWKGERGILGGLYRSYMGSAEFEFGAVPDALARFLKDTEPKVFGQVLATVPIDPLRRSRGNRDVRVRYLVRVSQEAKLIDLLQNWSSAMLNFKEIDVSLSWIKNMVFCIDRGFEAFMWNGKLGRRYLLEHVQSSASLLIKAGRLEPEDVDPTATPEQLLRIKDDSK